jgi:hypothetical protein
MSYKEVKLLKVSLQLRWEIPGLIASMFDLLSNISTIELTKHKHGMFLLGMSCYLAMLLLVISCHCWIHHRLNVARTSGDYGCPSHPQRPVHTLSSALPPLALSLHRLHLCLMHQPVLAPRWPSHRGRMLLWVRLHNTPRVCSITSARSLSSV